MRPEGVQSEYCLKSKEHLEMGKHLEARGMLMAMLGHLIITRIVSDKHHDPHFQKEVTRGSEWFIHLSMIIKGRDELQSE